MNAIELFMNAIAGLGILFFGIKMVTRNLGAIAGSGLRSGVARVSRRPLAAMATGTALGFVSQSGRTSSFILASFVHAGVIEARGALPIALWANFGCTLVIVAAVFPIHLFALFVLALAGAAIAFERPKPMLKSASAVFGLALMLFGLRMMSQSATSLTELGSFGAAIEYIRASLPLAILCGVVLTFVAQSHMAIMLIAVAMARQGLFGLPETLMLVFGAHAGSSLITWFTGFNFHGQPRQIVLAEIFYNFFAIVLFLALFAGDRLLAGGSGEARLTDHSGLDAGTLAAVIVIAVNALAPLILLLFRDLYLGLCARLSPPLAAEELGQPRFLRHDFSESPHTTLLLAEKEQLRLLERLPRYSQGLHGEAVAHDAPTPAAYHEAFGMVSGVIERAQTSLMAREMSAEDTEWLLGQQQRQEMLLVLEEACYELWQNALELEPELLAMRKQIVGELDSLLAHAVDTMKTESATEFAILMGKTNDCGVRMEKMRKDYLAASHHHSPDERSHILAVTSIFERVAAATRRLSTLLEKRPSMAV